MFLSTLLSALPLLTPALPQEPVSPRAAQSRAEQQEPAKKAKSNKKKNKKKSSKNSKSTAKKISKKGKKAANKQEPVSKKSAKKKSSQAKRKGKKAKQSNFKPKAKAKAKAKPQSMHRVRRDAQATLRSISSTDRNHVVTLADVDTGIAYQGNPILTVDARGNLAVHPNPNQPIQAAEWGTVSLQPSLLNLVPAPRAEAADSVKNTKKQARKKLRKRSQ